MSLVHLYLNIEIIFRQAIDLLHDKKAFEQKCYKEKFSVAQKQQLKYYQIHGLMDYNRDT